jgi:hypothetical protein
VVQRGVLMKKAEKSLPYGRDLKLKIAFNWWARTD